MEKFKIIINLILRFSLLLIGVILLITYYFDLGVSLNISSFWSVFIIVGLFVAFRYSKIKYRLENNIGSANGIGTTLLGKREINPDGSYIATKWFIFFLLPIFPINSYRVLPNKPEIGYMKQVTSYSIFEKVPFSKRQVVNTYLLVYGFIIIIFVILPIIIFR